MASAAARGTALPPRARRLPDHRRPRTGATDRQRTRVRPRLSGPGGIRLRGPAGTPGWWTFGPTPPRPRVVDSPHDEQSQRGDQLRRAAGLDDAARTRE